MDNKNIEKCMYMHKNGRLCLIMYIAYYIKKKKWSLILIQKKWVTLVIAILCQPHNLWNKIYIGIFYKKRFTISSRDISRCAKIQPYSVTIKWKLVHLHILCVWHATWNVYPVKETHLHSFFQPLKMTEGIRTERLHPLLYNMSRDCNLNRRM